MSNLKNYTDNFIMNLDPNNKFQLRNEEEKRLNGQFELHASHVTPLFTSKEEHENMHSRTR